MLIIATVCLIYISKQLVALASPIYASGEITSYMHGIYSSAVAVNATQTVPFTKDAERMSFCFSMHFYRT